MNIEELKTYFAGGLDSIDLQKSYLEQILINKARLELVDDIRRINGELTHLERIRDYIYELYRAFPELKPDQS